MAIVIGNEPINHSIASSLLQIPVNGCIDHIATGVGVASQSLDRELAGHFSHIVSIYFNLQAVKGCNIGAGDCIVVGRSVNHVER